MNNKNIPLFAGSDGTTEPANATTTTPAEPKGTTEPPKNPATEPANSGISDSEAKLLKEVMEKKALIKEQGEKLAKLEETMKTLNDLGGLDAFKTIIEKQKADDKKKLEEKGEWDKLKAQMAEDHLKATEGFKTQISQLQSELAKEKGKINELTIGNAFANSSFLKDKTILTSNKARKLYSDYFDIDADTGSIVAFDKPQGAKDRTRLVDQLGNGLSFENAIEKIVMADPDHEFLLRAKGSAGSGSSTAGSVNTTTTTPTKPLSGLDMIRAGLKKQKN